MSTSNTNGADRRPKIGLALSGGGFRASLFHLGVIRRLEELGIMKYVHTISSVSGGSIVAAYYLVEMEKRLRRCADPMSDPICVDTFRVQAFEEIAHCFGAALDHNLRSRALLFSVFYHPLLFLKSLLPTYSRADLMQKEYDDWFFDRATLDKLPSLTTPHSPESDPRPADAENPCSEVPAASSCRAGPRLVLNTTSLLTGERRAFTRQPISGFNELRRIDQNVLRLSKVVGASAGVPGVFPPTTISGDNLVDGGVSDNQGIRALLDVGSTPDTAVAGEAFGRGLDTLLVSDACGQMEPRDRVRRRFHTVMARSASILQFQLRKRTLETLRWWCGQGNNDAGNARECNNQREFAFVHLLLNIKDRGVADRVPTEYIGPLGGIRTDLDQFSFIEREVLMYHGYTLIDAQIKRHCPALRAWVSRRHDDEWPDLKRSPLFREELSASQRIEPCAGETRLRRRVSEVLTIGSHRLFLHRSWKKYRGKSWWVLGPSLVVLPGGHSAIVWGVHDRVEPLVGRIGEALCSVAPSWLGWIMETFVGVSHFPLDSRWLTSLVGVALWVYAVWFLTYVLMRWKIRHWDTEDYRSLTCCLPTVEWGATSQVVTLEEEVRELSGSDRDRVPDGSEL